MSHRWFTGKKWHFEKSYRCFVEAFGLSPMEEIILIRLRRLRVYDGTREATWNGDSQQITRDWLQITTRAFADQFKISQREFLRVLNRLESCGVISTKRSKQSGILVRIKNPPEIPMFKALQDSSLPQQPDALSTEYQTKLDQNNNSRGFNLSQCSLHGDINISHCNNVGKNTCKDEPAAESAAQEVLNTRSTTQEEKIPDIIDQSSQTFGLHNISNQPCRVEDTVEKSPIHNGIEKPIQEVVKNRPRKKMELPKDMYSELDFDGTPMNRMLIESRAQQSWDNYYEDYRKIHGHEATLAERFRARELRAKCLYDEIQIAVAVRWVRKNGMVGSGDPPRSIIGYLLKCMESVLDAIENEEAAQEREEQNKKDRVEKERFAAQIQAEFETKSHLFEKLYPKMEDRKRCVTELRSKFPEKFGDMAKPGSFTEMQVAIATWIPPEPAQLKKRRAGRG